MMAYVGAKLQANYAEGVGEYQGLNAEGVQTAHLPTASAFYLELRICRERHPVLHSGVTGS